MQKYHKLPTHASTHLRTEGLRQAATLRASNGRGHMGLASDDLARLGLAHGLSPWGAVVQSLDAPSAALVAPDTPLYPASMIKTPLAAVTLAEVAAGRFAIDDQIAVSAANLTHNDAPSPLVPGYRATVRELCVRAIAFSDNVATNELFDLVGRERASELARERLGLRATAFFRKLSGSEPLILDRGWDGEHRNTHPPADAAALLAAIARDEIPHADLLGEALAAQIWHEKLARGLRAGDRFAHKTGDTDEVTHDGGILTTREGRRYVIVVYLGNESSETNNARLASFMEALRALL